MRFVRLFLCCVMALASPALAERAHVFAAASLKEPLDVVAAAHGEAVVSYGGSGVLARQVTMGAPAGVIVLAHPDWIAALTAADALQPDSLSDVAAGKLVVIAPAGAAPIALSDLPGALGQGRLAMGFPDAVPAGQYGRAALVSLGLWEAVAPRVVPVDNVRAALALVARGEAAFGITYATDARVADVAIVATFPAESHPPIRYTAALTRQAGAGDAAFLDLLTGPVGQAALADAGFDPVTP